MAPICGDNPIFQLLSSRSINPITSLFFTKAGPAAIGYRDITPLTVTAKKATILMGLLGNFYTVFVVGIVIGKFFRSENKN
jgi:hypothetical protein